MGTHTTAKRRAILDMFEGCGLDVADDGAEPFTVESRKTGKDAIEGETREDGDTLDIRYRIVDTKLDDADAHRIIVIAYLDELTQHYWYNETRGRHSRLKVRFTNEASQVSSTVPYPDPE